MLIDYNGDYYIVDKKYDKLMLQDCYEYEQDCSYCNQLCACKELSLDELLEKGDIIQC